MHPNRATSTLFSNFLVMPTELTTSIKEHGITDLRAVVDPRGGAAGGSGRQTIDIPVGKLPDQIAIPPQVFLHLGYAPGDPMQFEFDGEQLRIHHFGKSVSEFVEDCEVDDDGVKIPPAWLIQAFTGAPDTIDHIESGKKSADFYVSLYNQQGGNFDYVKRVLDFGCGCGRVLSRMPDVDGARYYGVDLRDDALQWLRETMPDATFATSPPMPPVDPGATDFDLIYAVSVLTHLTQEQEAAWLDEWHRLLKPGGYVFATFRGDDWVDKFAIDNQKAAIRHAWRNGDGFCYQKHKYWEGIFPEFYSGTYHTIDYVQSAWGRQFEIVELLPAEGMPNEQNTAVLRKP